MAFEKRAYLIDITRRAPTTRAMRFVVDLLAGCGYNELFVHRGEFSSGFEDDPPALEDPRRLAAYCEMQGIKLVEIDPDGYDRLLLAGDTVAVSTESPRSLAGRVEEMRERMGRAEEAARLRKARRFLVTDFADECAWQPRAASPPGIILGGNFASDGRKAAKMDLERELDRVLDAPLGGLLLKLGTLYLRGGAVRDDSSEFFNILANEIGYSRHPGITETVLEDVGGVARGVRVAAERWTDRSDWAKEIVHMANLLDAACHRRDERRLRALRDEHGRVWALRFRPEGRVESLSRLPRF